MFALVLHDGTRLPLEDLALDEAMRTLVRERAEYLEIAGDPPRKMGYALALDELNLGRPGLFDGYSEGWQPPSAAEFRELIRVAKLTRSEAGRLVGVSPGKIGKWAGGASDVPYAVWRLLSVYSGLSPADVINNKCR